MSILNLLLGAGVLIFFTNRKSKYQLFFNLFTLFLGLVYVLVTLILSSQDLALRLDYDVKLYWFSALTLLLSIMCNIIMKYTNKWIDRIVIFIIMCLGSLPVFVFLVITYALDTTSEFEIIKEGSKNYLVGGEAYGWKNRYYHKYEVLSKYLRKANPVDYDIENVSETVNDGKSYEEYYLGR